MITFWQHENGRLVRREDEEIESGKNIWIDARSVTREDITYLEEELHIEQEHILDILDQDELSRIEKNDDYTLIIARLPVFVPSGDISYFTVPLGIILMNGKIITICWTECEVLKDISANRIKGITLADFPAFIVRLLSRADSTFLRYLKEINRRSTTIQSELQQSIKNNELIQLLNLEKSLVFFTTSLKSNQLLLEKLTKTKFLTFDEDDHEWLEDVEIDNRQAIEMADTYSNILSGMMDAFASVISNNLNIVMKRLTVISLILMIPTFIVSFFGMNIPLPFTNSGWIGIAVIAAACVASATAARFWLMNDKPVIEPRRRRVQTKKIKNTPPIKKIAQKKGKLQAVSAVQLLWAVLFTAYFTISYSAAAQSTVQNVTQVPQPKINESVWLPSIYPDGLLPVIEDKTVPQVYFPPFAASLTAVHSGQENPRFPQFIIGEHTQSYTSNRRVDSFRINKFETTYALWYAVRMKAEQELGYAFSNPGQEGSSGRRGRAPTEKGRFEPVTTINWRDAVVWCNALSELTGRTPCYTFRGKVLRSSADSSAVDLADCSWTADGYRLPTETEWEYAARKTNIMFQRGDLPSGSIREDGTSSSLVHENDISWTSGNTEKTMTVGTAGTPSKQTAFPSSGRANGQGLYDMSGNVLEFCWDWFKDYEDIPPGERAAGPRFGSERTARGGSWSPYASFIGAGDRYAYDPDEAYNYIGFRFCRTLTKEDFTQPDTLKTDEIIDLNHVQ